MPARILILTNGHLCRNPRVLKEATTLGLAGHNVSVIGVCNRRASLAFDAALAARAPFRFLPISLLPGAGPTAFARRLTLKLRRDAAARLGWVSIHALGPATALLFRARTEPADLIIAHNEIAHWAGLQLQALGRLVAADIEDWHSEDLLPIDRKARPIALLRQIEAQLLQRCTYTTTTSQALANALHTRYGGASPHVITNSFPLQPTARREYTDRPPAFFWFSQTIGPGRGLEAFLDAWAMTTAPSRVVLLGEISSYYRNQLLARIPPSRRPDFSVLGLASPLELPAMIAAHDIGLALENSAIVSRDLTITNKILQYLNAGLAIVATNTSGQREVLAQSPDAGIFIHEEDPAATARMLDALLVDRSRLLARQRLARRLAEDVYTWENESPKLRHLVEQALKSKWAKDSSTLDKAPSATIGAKP